MTNQCMGNFNVNSVRGKNTFIKTQRTQSGGITQVDGSHYAIVYENI